MDYQALIIISLILSLAIILSFYLAVINGKRLKNYNLILRDEKARSNFADTRRKLFKYMSDGKIDPKDELFQKAYALTTAFMKAKGNYKELGGRLVALFSEAGKSRQDKKPIPNQEYADVLKDTMEAFGFIAFEYSWIDRVACRIWKLFDKEMSKGRIMIIMTSLSRDIKEKKEMQEEYKLMKKEYNANFSGFALA